MSCAEDIAGLMTEVGALADELREAWGKGELEEYVDEYIENGDVRGLVDLCTGPGHRIQFVDFSITTRNGLVITYQKIEGHSQDGKHYEYYMGDTEGSDKELMDALWDYLEPFFTM